MAQTVYIFQHIQKTSTINSFWQCLDDNDIPINSIFTAKNAVVRVLIRKGDQLVHVISIESFISREKKKKRKNRTIT